MSRETFEVSKEGVKVSYGRFLSDSAGGYILILIIVYAIAKNVPIPDILGGGSWGNFIPSLPTLGDQAEAAIILSLGVLLLLLGPPLGLAVNGVSWFVLGGIQVRFMNYWVDHPHNWLILPLTYSTNKSYNLTVLQRYFKFMNPDPTDNERDNLYSRIAFLEKTLQIYFYETMDRLEYLSGIKIFIRNLSLMALSLFAYSLLISSYRMAFYMFVLFVLLTIFACLLELYRSLDLLFVIHVMCREHGSNGQNKPMKFSEVVATLVAIGKQRRQQVTATLSSTS